MRDHKTIKILAIIQTLVLLAKVTGLLDWNWMSCFFITITYIGSLLFCLIVMMVFSGFVSYWINERFIKSEQKQNTREDK